MTLYARANLGDMNDTTGWSTTSGGPSAGRAPSGYEKLIFDQNSGPSRTITGVVTAGSRQISGLDMTNSNPMNFTGGFLIGGNSVLKGTFGPMQLWSAGGATKASPFTLDASQAVIASLTTYGDNYTTLTGDLTVTGGINFTSSGYSDAYLTAQGHNITCSSFNCSGSGTDSSGTFYQAWFNLGGGTLTVTGSNASTGGSVLTGGGGGFYSSGGGTIILTDTSNAVKNVNFLGGGNFVNATGNGRGTGGVNFTMASSWGTFDGGKAGAVNTFRSDATYTATNWILDGSGTLITLKASGTTAAILAKSSAGTIPANFCNFSYIAAAASPATAIRATNSKMSNSTGVTLVGMTSRSMPFF